MASSKPKAEPDEKPDRVVADPDRQEAGDRAWQGPAPAKDE